MTSDVREINQYRALFDLTGRVALVVGAGSGIGEAVAKTLAGLGARVVCADANASAAQKTATVIAAESGAATAIGLDMMHAADVDRAVGGLVKEFGRLDVAVTTPSVNVRKRILDYSVEEYDKVVNLNLGGTFNIIRAVGRVMQAQGSGSIIAFSSIRAQTVEPGQGVYAATKAGTTQLIRTLAAELGPCGVRANVIAPGVVDTPLTKQIKDHKGHHDAYASKSVFGRWGSAQEIAGAVAFLACDASSYVTGSQLFVDGGWTGIDGRYEPPV